ncbi:hypothetical protein [Streptomyces sp. CBMA152]|uniref:hypothetical protein n=1 Tax=Streptomyces sp. CBMA152 TaxID=1896312 RepID=UPI0016606760|nr:hypothetical protein [Streptomyces sp. CBMA152]MBD0746701.1 hypothetical protein [Streptomyces sp. CBMA152]
MNLSHGRNSKYGEVVWAHLFNGSNTDLGTDWVWMDWSDTKGSWHQCGPAVLDGSQGLRDRWTWAVNEVPGRYFHACAMWTGDNLVQRTGWHQH